MINVEATLQSVVLRDSPTSAFCRGFRTPGSREPPHDEVAGVRKAPRHEVAGSWALTGQRALWGFDAGADLNDSVTLAGFDPGCLQYGRSAECSRHFGGRSKRVKARSVH